MISRISRKTQRQMFLLISGGHICAPQRDTNVASPYNTIQSLPRTQTSLFELHFLWWKCACKGRREGDNKFACRPYPSHGPLRLITSHSFRARLCHAKNEAPEEEADTKPYKFRWNVFPNISHMKYRTNLILGEAFCIFIFVYFLDSGLSVLNGLKFYFWFRDSENPRLINYSLPFLFPTGFISDAMQFKHFLWLRFEDHDV